MKTKYFCLLSIILLLSTSAFALGGAKELAIKAASGNVDESASAIKALREMRQKGVDALFDVYSNEIRDYFETGEKTKTWQRIANAIDAVAMQKDAFSSQLFWYTDFEKAQLEAKKTNKPILSLRLLGNLNEEYTCANSRFFRSIYYSDKKISKLLREKYVLHWKSVRPVPKITIDYGDGRKLVRTITGNSIHYILDNRGRILDALPGLYNPQDFLFYLTEINSFNQMPRKTKNFWNKYRETRRSGLLRKWQRDLRKIGATINSTPKSSISLPPPTKKKKANSENTATNEKGKKPTAIKAARLAVTKSAVELPTVRSISNSVESLKKGTTFDEWKTLANLYGTKRISNESKTFVYLKAGINNSNGRKLSSLIANLEKYVSIDTVQNEYLFHTKIYEWLNSKKVIDLEAFNEKVYAELFLTPKSDKWLGLYSSDIFSAIDNNGVVK